MDIAKKVDKEKTDKLRIWMEENNIYAGINIDEDTKRYYPYNNLASHLLGFCGTDNQGLYGIEQKYENVLKGVPGKIVTTKGANNVELPIESETYINAEDGLNLVLSIDEVVQHIAEKHLQQAIEETKCEEGGSIIVMRPKTGEILAMAGKQIVLSGDAYKIYDYTPGIFTTSVVAGSVVKGASQIVGYNNDALEMGEIRDDSCIKIAATPLKCSWKYLGKIDDIEALKQSSNTYQFNTAINVGKGKYVYDRPIALDNNAFNIYRDTFKEFGLGVKTGIDLPNESLGYKGNNRLSGFLLDFSILYL